MDPQSERARIAADFHDGPLQAFAVLRMRLHVLRRLIERGDEAALQEAIQLDQLCEARLAEMRGFLAKLRGQDIGGHSWSALVERFRRESGLHIEAHIDDQAPEVLKPIIAEALHNVHKHSDATAVLTVVRLEGLAWLAIVEDNGKGIPPDAVPESIQSRATAAGGSIALSGTRIEIRVPA
ncbi:MAG: hypothetical protein IT168_07475 [Bryobacterales bacterium]|nr:hypothetical protein [Bryobacterales bacterium]